MSNFAAPSFTPNLRRWPGSWYLLAVVLGVFVAAYSGLILTREAGRLAIVWPANAVMLVFIIRRPLRQWPLILGCGWLANYGANFLIDDITAASLILPFCNVLEVSAFGYYLCRFFGNDFDLKDNCQLLRFLGLVCVTPLLSGPLAAAVLHEYTQIDYLPALVNWYLADALGLLVFTPLLISLRPADWRPLFGAPLRVKTLLVIALAAITLTIIFTQNSFPLPFLCFPVLVLSAFWLGVTGVASMITVTALVACIAAYFNLGPFYMVKGIVMQAYVLESFIAVTVITSLPVATAIAQRRRLEQELLKARQVAENANQAKSSFLTSMSHELRTPLNAIIGFGQLLLFNTKNPLTAQQQAQTQNIIDGGEYLLKLINDILDLARIEAGKVSIQQEAISVTELLQELDNLLQPLLLPQKMVLQITLPQNNQTVEADYTHLLQVLVNLGSNAIKYNRPGGLVRIATENLPQKLRISIADEGAGIPIAKQAELFQPFNRLGAETGTIEGTGIGLSIAKHLIKAMAGEIDFSSIEGQGTTFWIDIPLLTTAPPRQTRALTTGPLPAMLPSQIRILYVEDKPTNILLMRNIIQEFFGQEITVATTGADGIRQAHAWLPDFIILDIHLPDMLGYDMLPYIKANPATAKIPIIALSADATAENVEQCRAAGFDYFFSKPFNIKELVEYIQNSTLSTTP